ncbi:M1 family metallopeptidase [Catenuloplanes sp. NPDC051500]|uniref:M1 family metallopeptidase n=1 Tax=Catenuloplanes sp. NPDC051500 TaxID=3363959 RepID=UPI0037965959
MLRRTTLVVTAITAMVLSTAQGAQAHGGGFTPGASGVGDAYYPLDGNGGYDVRHYDLDVKYTPATDVLAGTATISARATQNLSAFNLDFEGLTIRSLTVDGTPARYARNGGELTITPRHGLPKGRSFTVVVRYDGVPQTIDDPNLGRTGVFHTDDGMVIAGQPDVAATWYPVNDHPLDKATYTIKVTVPEGLEAVANGALIGSRTRHGWTTWTWDAAEPMASYLVTANVGEFDLHAYKVDGIRYWDAVDPDLTETGERVFIDKAFARHPEINGFLADNFGRYPFRTSGGIVDDMEGLYFALETQTRPIYSKYFFTDQSSADNVVVHELAHQWYGDSLAVARWQDIWLNEGFATYAEWLWAEHEGRATPQQLFDANYQAIPADDPFWQLTIGDPGPVRLFDYPIYLRGAMTLQVLRNRVGDDAFFRIIKGWATTRAGGNVTTPQFIAYAERVSGRQLDDLFDTWLYTATRPVVETSAARTALPGPAAPTLRK